MRAFRQVDVFTQEPGFGNPVAVVLEADGLTDEEMSQFANWTNLSETTFVLPPTDPAADYRVRIFTPNSEMPFAGHPTIGTCHGWLEAGGIPHSPDLVIQECGVGLVPLRRSGPQLAFAAPALIRGGPVSEADLEPVLHALKLERDQVIDAQWADNGPGWLAVMLESADAVLDLDPDFSGIESTKIGVVGPYPLGVVGKSADRQDFAIEVRAFFSANGRVTEDPVTGSLNAAVAQWLLAAGTLTSPYLARQGTALGRRGYVHVSEDLGDVWIGGDAVTVVAGQVSI